MSPVEGAAWELTRLLTPRGSVRVDVDGANDYALTHRVEDDAPASPWAMNLADPSGRYRYLCFDLDAKNGNAAYDAGRLSHWLDELNIDHLVCVSGPSGGRHVWISLEESAPAELAGTIAHLASQLLPSLDTTPLCNPATGCVRPPYTPHRRGGRSEPQGPIDVLLEHGVDVDALDALQAFLVDAGATIAPPPQSLVKGMAHDSEGHPYLIGAKRAVSTRIRELLNLAPDDDTSRTQGAVLAGCARARWRYADVLALLDTSPALEHARSRPGIAGRRTPRPHTAAVKLLEADWARAVYYVAQNPLEYDGEDEEFAARMAATSAAVAACQERADASPGRWGLDAASRAQRAAQGRYSHRAVLDAVCLYLAQAAREAVEVDSRRLSADTGYGRETCRLALLALSTPDTEGDVESAWLVRVADARGVHGARYRLSERFSTGTDEPEWAQAAMRPSPSTAPADAQRTWWINRLGTRLQLLAHDTFAAPGSLGRTAGRAYLHLPEEGVAELAQLSTAAGMTYSQLHRALRRLHSAGLASRSKAGWHRSPIDIRDHVAIALGVDGYLLERGTRYDVERGVWAWWSAECTWMRKRHKKRRGRRASTGIALFAQNDRPDFTRYPRSRTGNPDHAQARALVEAGILTAHLVDELAA
ncbi:hypothetical protein J7E29_16650 [Streptomyces sp. ISL-90]|nr:hypothetical protein [Streptomyces sp. ISL-90]